jgi:cytochrome P450
MLHLQRRADQWIEPEEFIPDRFDPESKYYLTPSGKKRHPMSFGPFLGGKRICLGKTFVESVSKIIGPTLLASLDFEFLDKTAVLKKPANNMMSNHEPIVMVKVKEITL